MVSFTKTKENIAMVLDGELITWSSEHPEFETMSKMIDKGDTLSLLQFLAPMMGSKRSKMELHIRLLRASKLI
tara:strand:- start:882 stop:1100 length:219 start_codon:yes stop_codon:yes gene_type:complete